MAKVSGVRRKGDMEKIICHHTSIRQQLVQMLKHGKCGVEAPRVTDGWGVLKMTVESCLRAWGVRSWVCFVGLERVGSNLAGIFLLSPMKCHRIM